MTQIGDMAQSYALRRHGTALKAALNRLTQEIGSGRSADVAMRLGGRLSPLADVERGLTLAGSRATAASEAAAFAGAAQLHLDRLGTAAEAGGAALLAAGASTLDGTLDMAASEAARGLADTVASLNAQSAGRSLFAGTATTATPIVPAEDIMSALRTRTAGLTGAAEIRAAAEAWFADPDGFRAVAYRGSDVALSPFGPVSGEAPRADDAALVGLVKGYALAALAGGAGSGLPAGERRALLAAGGETLLSQQDALSGVRGTLGHIEARIEAASVQAETERLALEQARAELTSADPFETATGLEAVQGRIEALYVVTARNARLSLVSFLK